MIVLNWLEDKHWLANHAKIYIETQSKDLITQRPFQLNAMPENWRLLKQKIAGDVQYQLLERINIL